MNPGMSRGIQQRGCQECADSVSPQYGRVAVGVRAINIQLSLGMHMIQWQSHHPSRIQRVEIPHPSQARSITGTYRKAVRKVNSIGINSPLTRIGLTVWLINGSGPQTNTNAPLDGPGSLPSNMAFVIRPLRPCQSGDGLPIPQHVEISIRIKRAKGS
jgi:hypothetical protein